MKRLLLLLCALLSATFVLQAAEYENATVRFTIPDNFELKPYTADGYEGFEASNGDLKLVLFTLRFKESINRRENLKISDTQWLVSLGDAAPTASLQPIGRRYDRVSTYLKDGRQIRIYRYVAARSLCFLVAENQSGDWEQADAVARSQRYQKSFSFYLQNFGNGLITFVLWCALISGVGIIIGNVINKFRNRKFRLYTIPVILLCVAGLCIFGWPPTMGSLLLAIWPAAIVTGIIGDNDTTRQEESDNDIDDPSTFDGTGPTIHYDF